MKRLFVTGSAGFIGSNFVHYMLEKHWDLEICSYDKLTYAGNLDNLKDLPLDATHQFIQGDINTEGELKYALAAFKPDAIVHFAAESHVDNSLESPQVFLETNILGTETILRAISNFPSIKKMVHISTDEVYGSLAAGEAHEDHAFDPNSPYSVSKASADMLCRAYFVSYGTPVSIVRGSNCFGPRQHEEKLIPRTITRLLQGLKMGIYGDGLNVREWTYTEDFCSGVETVLMRGKLGEAYNLGSGQDNRINNNRIVNNLCALIGRDPAESIKYIEDRLGHDQRYALNNSKLKELGWFPQYSVSEGLAKTVDWYKQNQ